MEEYSFPRLVPSTMCCSGFALEPRFCTAKTAAWDCFLCWTWPFRLFSHKTCLFRGSSGFSFFSTAQYSWRCMRHRPVCHTVHSGGRQATAQQQRSACSAFITLQSFSSQIGREKNMILRRFDALTQHCRVIKLFNPVSQELSREPCFLSSETSLSELGLPEWKVTLCLLLC